MSIFGTSKPFICPPTATFSSKSYSGNGSTITVTLGAGHGISVGQFLYVSGVTIFEVTTSGATTVSGSSTCATSSTADIHLGYWFKNSIFEFNFCEPDQINHRSVINGNRTNTFLGDYGSFTITERLWQHTSLRTAKLKFGDLYTLYHTDVWLIPHSKYIQDSSSPVTCYFKTFKPIYYKNFINYDAVVCEFETNKYHDVSKLLI